MFNQKSKLKYQDFFKDVFERYSQMVFSYLLEKVEDRVDALDIAQEVFIHLWKYGRNIRQDEKYEGIVIKACRQEIYRFFRSGYRLWLRQVVSLESAEASLIDNSDSELEYKMEKEGQLEQMYAALELIPVKRKEILLMNKLEGKTRKEIAIEMEMSKSAIGYHIDKAMQFLKNKLSRSG